MKYKKYSYLLVLLLMLIVGIDRTYAWQEETCYYMSDDGNFKARLNMRWRESMTESKAGNVLSDYAQVYIDKLGENNYPYDKEGIINWWKSPNLWKRKECITGKSVCFEFKYNNIYDADTPEIAPTCPKYLVLEDNGQYAVWATDSNINASKAQLEIRKNGYTGYYGKTTDINSYFSEFVEEGLVKIEDGEPTCEDYEAIFGSKDDTESIRYMVDTILQYVRIIVPILIILLGTIDFAKAVMAGKEDNMRKAQSDFIKRIIMGVAVFFVPVIVDVIMELADIVWAGEYIHCDF